MRNARSADCPTGWPNYHLEYLNAERIQNVPDESSPIENFRYELETEEAHHGYHAGREHICELESWTAVDQSLPVYTFTILHLSSHLFPQFPWEVTLIMTLSLDSSLWQHLPSRVRNPLGTFLTISQGRWSMLHVRMPCTTLILILSI